MAKEIATEVFGETITLYPQKAAYWNRRKTLILSDLHWGKAEVFQKNGIPVPSTVLLDDLQQLSDLLDRTGAERILVLGDLLHSADRLNSWVVETISAWRQTYPQPIICIRGNHDPKDGQLPEAWQIAWIDGELWEEPFCFRHEPKKSRRGFTWCGHIHPVIHVGRARDRMRLPCFWIGSEMGVLPSFGFFTGGYRIEPKLRDAIFAVSDQEIFSMT